MPLKRFGRVLLKNREYAANLRSIAMHSLNNALLSQKFKSSYLYANEALWHKRSRLDENMSLAKEIFSLTTR